MITPSDTPETDAAMAGKLDSDAKCWALMALCHGLERERNALRERLAEISDARSGDGESRLSTPKVGFAAQVGVRTKKPLPGGAQTPPALASDAPCPYWQPLFNHMSEEHGLTLLDAEMHEIARKVDESRSAAEPVKLKHCDDCAPEFIECWNDGERCRKSALGEPLAEPQPVPALTPHQIWILQNSDPSFNWCGYQASATPLVYAGLLEAKEHGYGITDAGRRALKEMETREGK